MFSRRFWSLSIFEFFSIEESTVVLVLGVLGEGGGWMGTILKSLSKSMLFSLDFYFLILKNWVFNFGVAWIVVVILALWKYSS